MVCFAPVENALENAGDKPSESEPRRRRTWLRRVVFSVSLTMSVIFASLWVRSFFRSDIFKLGVLVTGQPLNGSEWDSWFDSNSGNLRWNVNHVHWQYERTPVQMGESSGPGWYSAGEPRRNSRVPVPNASDKTTIGYDYMGFGAGRYVLVEGSGSNRSARSHTAIRMPHWVALMIALIPAAVIFRRYRRDRRRLREGLCITCGYDLRGGTTRCPECGTPKQAGQNLQSPPSTTSLIHGA